MKKPEKELLFNGEDLKDWLKLEGGDPCWDISGGVATVTSGNIYTKAVFGDAYIHLEFRIPDMPEAEGQWKGNSGVYIHGRYEIQVLDSYGLEDSGRGDCGAIYDHNAPLLNNCLPAERWQSYDIVFRAPRFAADGSVSEKPRLTLLHNGLPIHNNLVLEEPTGGALTHEFVAEGPLLLQDHGCPVSYRNIWLYRLPADGADRY